MKVSCSYCGIVEKPHICPHSKRKTDRNRKDNKIYESKSYRSIRQIVLRDYRHMCLWSLYVDGNVKKATDTHHIIEILDDESKATDYDNLIPLTRFNHRVVVENLYKINKEETQELLRDMLKDFKRFDFTLGKYKERARKIENKFKDPPPGINSVGE